jgi:hypothetical protein
VRHQQVLALEAGRYPLLVVIRMTVKWGRIGPWLEDVTAEEVALAKKVQAEADREAAERARLAAEGGSKRVLIRKAADVPEAERRRMFWVADREQAEAWLRLHNVHGATLEIP